MFKLVTLLWYMILICCANEFETDADFEFDSEEADSTSSSKLGPNNRIINGKVVDIRDFPYQVALVRDNGFQRKLLCGGVLIKPQVVFTAAHCTHARGYIPRKNLYVIVGANTIHDPRGQLHEIKKIMKHPDFSYYTFDNDISALILKKPVTLSERVRHIPISFKDHRAGTKATVSGWGRTEYGPPSYYLRAVNLALEDWGKCQDHFRNIITPNMVCVKPDRKTTYFGDSGGPLVVDGKLLGLVSFGRRLNKNRKTTVFTRVKNFHNFFENAVPEYNQ